MRFWRLCSNYGVGLYTHFDYNKIGCVSCRSRLLSRKTNNMVKLPDRWLDYSACGNRIEGTRIVCFKTPLRDNYFHWGTTEDDVWRVSDVIKAVPNLGLVIDLTFSTKYYNPEELLDNGIQHKKILCEGHVIPRDHVVNEFINTIQDFINENRCNDKLIGVHCTHGLNRTGYLVCRYMIESLSINADRAVRAFEVARGHQMERRNYLNDICRHCPSNGFFPEYY